MGLTVSCGRTAAVGVALLLIISCTRMPTAPPVEIAVTGRITGPDGDPMGALLAFLSVQQESPRVSNFAARADSAGMYTVRLPTGTYDVVIQPSTPGLLYHVARGEFTRWSTRFDHWFSGYVLSGTVHDPNGGIVDSGRVFVQVLTPTRYSIGATDLTHGQYSFLLSQGTYELHAVSGEYWSGLSRTASGPISVQSNTTLDLDMGGIQVTGTVFGPSDVPMERVAVDAYGEDLNDAHNLSGSDGHYRLWLQPGAYRFRVWPFDSFHIAGRLTAPVPVHAPSNFDFDLAGVEWTGVVQWRGSGDPVPEVWVGVYNVETDMSRGAGGQTDSDGRFRLVVEPGQAYDLFAYSGGIQEHLVGSLVARTDTSFVILADPGSRAPTPAPRAVRDIPSPGSSAP